MYEPDTLKQRNLDERSSRPSADESASQSIRHHADFRSRSPRPAVDFGHRPELDEVGLFGIKGHGRLALAFVRHRALDDRLAEVLAVIAHVKFVFLDGAVGLLILARQIGEPL